MAATNGTICIYCRGWKPIECFNAEHVVPKSFGRFDSALTLTCVCADCNHKLGAELDLPLARGTPEGLLRYEKGVRTTSKKSAMLSSRLHMTLPGPKGWEGVRVFKGATSDDPEPRLRLPTQVAFEKKDGGGFEHVLLSEIQSDGVDDERFAPRGEIRIFGDGGDECRRAVSELEARGIPFKERGRFESPGEHCAPVWTKLEALFDTVLRRAIAKIGFNYLAWRCAELEDPDYVLRADFDVVRRFIRYGEEPSNGLVRPIRGPILIDEPADIATTDGHLVAVAWEPRLTHLHLLGRVGMFNHSLYEVRLGYFFTGLYRDDLPCGHHFNWRDRRVKPLIRIPVILATSGRW